MSGGVEALVRASEAVAAASSALTALPDDLFACSSAELGPWLAALADLGARADAAQVAVVAEAASRGVIADSDAAGPADWVIQHCGPATQTRDAVALARVAVNTDPDLHPVQAAVRQARLSPLMADAVVKEFGILTSAIPDDMHPDVLTALVDLACTGHSQRSLSGFRERLIGQYSRENELQDRHDKLQARRGMSPFARDLTGAWHASLVLDPESHATLAAVLDGLSAPITTTDEHGQLVRDERTADQRRLDALLEACSAYPSLNHATRLAPRTKLIVTMDYQHLCQATRYAVTGQGHTLAPHTVRKLACDAGVIPMVLGSDSQPLDVGRQVRLATPAMITALHQRDNGCTFPGCTRPVGWTRAHHVKHWLNGGVTSVNNMALLFEQHHTTVHQRHYTATITPTSVTWHLPTRGAAGPARRIPPAKPPPTPPRTPNAQVPAHRRTDEPPIFEASTKSFNPQVAQPN